MVNLYKILFPESLETLDSLFKSQIKHFYIEQVKTVFKIYMVLEEYIKQD